MTLHVEITPALRHELHFQRGAGALLIAAPDRHHVALRQIESEMRARAVLARHANLAAEEPGDLAADRKTAACTAELARGRGIGLLEGLENDPLLLVGNPDTGIGNAEGDDRRRAVQRLVVGAPTLPNRRRAQRHAPLLRELEGIAE